jgi:hypothetical protein
MKHFFYSLFCAATLCAALHCPISAIAGNSQDTIESKVKGTGLKYRKDDDGDFRFTFKEGGGRTQLVCVFGKAETFLGTDFVEVWSVAVRGKTRPVNGRQMRTLLKDSDKELGHWCLRKPSRPDGKWVLYYSIKLPVSATADEFKAAIQTCSSVADDVENDLVGTDDN